MVISVHFCVLLGVLVIYHMLISGVFVKLFNVISLYLLSLDYIKISENFKKIYIFIILGLSLKGLLLIIVHKYDCANLYLYYYWFDAYNVLDDYFLQSGRGIKISDLLNPDTSSGGSTGGGGPNPGGGPGPNTGLAAGGGLSTQASTNDSDTAPTTDAVRQPNSDEYVNRYDKNDLWGTLTATGSPRLRDVLSDRQFSNLRKILMYDYNNAPNPGKIYYTHFASGDLNRMGNVTSSRSLIRIVLNYPDV